MPKITEKHYSMDEIARRIGISRSYVGKLMTKRKLGYYRIGRRRVVGESHIEEYLSHAERKATIRRNVITNPLRGE